MCSAMIETHVTYESHQRTVRRDSDEAYGGSCDCLQWIRLKVRSCPNFQSTGTVSRSILI